MTVAVASRAKVMTRISHRTLRPAGEISGAAVANSGRASSAAQALGGGGDAVAQLLPGGDLVRHHPVHLHDLAWAHILFVAVPGMVRAAEHQKRAELGRHLGGDGLQVLAALQQAKPPALLLPA